LLRRRRCPRRVASRASCGSRPGIS
jgi:hypothetical protein